MPSEATLPAPRLAAKGTRQGTGMPGQALPQPGRCVVMGVIDVTPDSFSDGGKVFHPEYAVKRGLDLMRRGADIIDVGGESTRPGAVQVPLAEELRRVVPVVTELAAAGAFVSVHTVRTRAAEAAIAAGARMVNDVSSGLADPAMLPLAARCGFPYVVMHRRGHSATMQSRAFYRDVVAEVLAELRGRIGAAADAGVAFEQLIVDPGLGFAKTDGHNWQILARMQEFCQLGFPVLVGASRKPFLGRLLAGPDGERRAAERDSASAAISALAAVAGVWGVRVHDVEASADAVRVVAALRARAAPSGPPAGSPATGPAWAAVPAYDYGVHIQ